MKSVTLDHRLMPGYDASEVEDMTGSIEISLLKASAVLKLLSDVVIHDTVNELDREQHYWAINSALCELSDITAVIDAYHQAQKNPEL